MASKEIFLKRAPGALFFVAVAVLPLVSGNQYHLTVGIFIGLYAIIAIGLALLLGYAGQVSMAQATFFGIGAYASAILTTTGEVNPWLAMAVRHEQMARNPRAHDPL